MVQPAASGTPKHTVEHLPAHCPTSNETTTAAVPVVNLGAVFTRRWVVELILDMAGYTPDQPLFDAVTVEPACGHGAFLEVIVERLVASCEAHDRPLTDAKSALVALDIDPNAVEQSRSLARNVLRRHGVATRTAQRLAANWITQSDFLLQENLPSADWVLGNPPYVRIEDVHADLMSTYRRRWQTMSGRADVYVGFYEASLRLLKPNGKLAFICADRWMRNRYGAHLRRMIETHYSIDVSVLMHSVDAFEHRVSAYPAITIMSGERGRRSFFVEANAALDASAAERLIKTWERGDGPTAVDPAFRASWTKQHVTNGNSWPAGTPEALARLSDLEERFPTLEETGAIVRVGIASGAEDVYVVNDPGIVEPERLLPTVGAKETTLGGIDWRGRHLINPWGDDGIVDLNDFPRLQKYLEINQERLKARHVAMRNPEAWWRTIDRVHPRLATEPKLLIPDLKDKIHPVLDHGQFMPLHNLYYITSDHWDLAVLGGLLMSDIANSFVEAYSVRMANGFMRVSAQYLRRVRLPHPETLEQHTADDLKAAFWNRDQLRASQAAADAYNITVKRA